MDYLAPAAGMLILLVLLRDVVLTVFHPEGYGGPLFHLLRRTVWGVCRLAGRRSDGSLRTELLSMAGPALAVLTPATWLFTLTVGFALIYLPWVLVLIEIPGDTGPAWAEAFYHSLNAAATLGLGDVRGEQLVLRWVTAVQALAGFGLVTAALSYFMAVYRELPIMRTAAMELHRRLTDDDVLDDIRDEEQRAEWDKWFEDMARTLFHLRLSLAQYPILHYFRPRYLGDEFLLQLGRLLDINAELDAKGDVLSQRAALRALSSGLRDYVDELHELFIGGSGTDSGDRTREKHDAVLRYFLLR